MSGENTSILMNKVIIAVTSLSCTLLVAAFFYFSDSFNETKKQSSKKVEAQKDTPTISIQGMVLKEQLKKKDCNLVLRAKESKIYHTSQTIACHDTSCKLFDNETQIAKIVSTRALIYRAKKEAHFLGPVSGTFKELSLNGYDIIYNFSTQHIFSNKKIIYTHPQFTLKAEKSTLDINKERVEMKEVVSEFFIPSAHQPQQQSKTA